MFVCQSDSTLADGKDEQDPKVAVTGFMANADNTKINGLHYIALASHSSTKHNSTNAVILC